MNTNIFFYLFMLSLTSMLFIGYWEVIPTRRFWLRRIPPEELDEIVENLPAWRLATCAVAFLVSMYSLIGFLLSLLILH